MCVHLCLSALEHEIGLLLSASTNTTIKMLHMLTQEVNVYATERMPQVYDTHMLHIYTRIYVCKLRILT